jgi:pSer/pThr/pTyr-binding forkhead associated (FHA) protein
MKVVLVNIGPPERRIVLDNLPAMIGRDDSADISLRDSWVGWFQCILDQDEGKLRVLDLGSQNGTFVNGARVRTAELKVGDTLTVGRTSYVLVCWEPCPNDLAAHGTRSA